MSDVNDIIGMAEMNAIFSVTDRLGLSREAISVPLEKADPGGVKRTDGGMLEIVVPRDEALGRFLDRLHADLLRLGYRPVESDEDAD